MIAFSSELPRTLVFIQEQGSGDVATRDLPGSLRDAGSPLMDPALAHTDMPPAVVAGRAATSGQ